MHVRDTSRVDSSGGPSDSPEQVTPPDNPGRENVEDSPGEFASAAARGGQHKAQDQSFER